MSHDELIHPAFDDERIAALETQVARLTHPRIYMGFTYLTP